MDQQFERACDHGVQFTVYFTTVNFTTVYFTTVHVTTVFSFDKACIYVCVCMCVYVCVCVCVW